MNGSLFSKCSQSEKIWEMPAPTAGKGVMVGLSGCSPPAKYKGTTFKSAFLSAIREFHRLADTMYVCMYRSVSVCIGPFTTKRLLHSVPV